MPYMNIAMKNIVIVGQGAMGLLWYHHISQQLHTETPTSLNKLTLLSSKQNSLDVDTYQFTPYQKQTPLTGCIRYAQTVDIAQADVFILCVKSYQTLSTIEQLTDKANKPALFILAHNGMGTFEQISPKVLERHAIAALLTTHGSLKQDVLNIKHTGIGVSDLGFLHHNKKVVNEQEAKQLTKLLNAALPNVNFHRKIVEKQWLKLAINCVINPITAIHNIRNGNVAKQDYRKEVIAIIEEVCCVSQKENITLNSERLILTVLAVAKQQQIIVPLCAATS